MLPHLNLWPSDPLSWSKYPEHPWTKSPRADCSRPHAEVGQVSSLEIDQALLISTTGKQGYLILRCFAKLPCSGIETTPRISETVNLLIIQKTQQIKDDVLCGAVTFIDVYSL